MSLDDIRALIEKAAEEFILAAKAYLKKRRGSRRGQAAISGGIVAGTARLFEESAIRLAVIDLSRARGLYG
ncbi:MAG: hypothetical protein KatS3mg131_2103 [Candidatus Tectimicrobiota bacterium]|nr:MAG: hypothetical protein KatS3mg131_2103 [Candidatus Tectomicrobia bacterium]